MNIQKIKYFIDLVECKNFTETAKKNYVSQTTISQSIAALESEFGVQLIDRKRTPVEPTQAGILFYEEALILWKQMNHMSQKMSDFLNHYTQVLHIEYAAPTDVQSLLKFIPSFKQKFPNVKLELDKVPLKNISEFLQKGIYDIAVAFDSEFKDKEDIRTHVLYQGRYQAAVSKQHPLAQKKIITKEELYEYPLIMLNQSVLGTSYPMMVENAIQDGFHPKIVRTVDDVETEIFYILTEYLIGFFPDNYQFSCLNHELNLLSLNDSHHTFKIEAAYHTENRNPALKLFFKHILNLISE